MTLRIIVRTDDAGMACNVGGSVSTLFKTFEVADSELESYLTAKMGEYSQRQVVGVEVVAPPRS